MPTSELTEADSKYTDIMIRKKQLRQVRIVYCSIATAYEQAKMVSRIFLSRKYSPKMCVCAQCALRSQQLRGICTMSYRNSFANTIDS